MGTSLNVMGFVLNFLLYFSVSICKRCVCPSIYMQRTGPDTGRIHAEVMGLFCFHMNSQNRLWKQAQFIQTSLSSISVSSV